ncbi:MAG: STAS domain-containing protein [Candidatus Thiodiazotropha sp.]
MSIEISTNEDGCVIVIDDEMTIYTAASLKKDLLEKISDCRSIEVILEKVTEMDTAGVQIMLMLFADAKKQGHEIHFSSHSAAVVDVLETFNLAAHFADPIVIPAQGGKS